MKNLIRKILKEGEDPWEWVTNNPDYVDISNVEVGDTVRIEVINSPGTNKMNHSYGVNPHIFDNQVGEVTKKSYSDDTDEVFIHVSNWENHDWGDVYFGNSDARMGTQYRYHVLDRKNINESEGFKDSTEEDWEWTEDVPSGELGDYFTEDDISYSEEDEDKKINLYPEEVVFNLPMKEFTDLIYDGHDDWVLDTLITHGGTYVGGDDTGYMDDEEINYIGWHLTEEQRNRLQEILDDPRVLNKVKEEVGDFNPNQKELFKNMPWHVKQEKEALYKIMGKIDVDKLIEDQQFRTIGDVLKLTYKGRNDWDDFASEALWAMEIALDENRWTSMNNTYNGHLEKMGIEIEYDHSYYSGNSVKITTPFPFKGKIYDMTDIINSLGFDDFSWSDGFHDEYNTEGSEENIQHHFESLLDKLEEVLEDEDFGWV